MPFHIYVLPTRQYWTVSPENLSLIFLDMDSDDSDTLLNTPSILESWRDTQTRDQSTTLTDNSTLGPDNQDVLALIDDIPDARDTGEDFEDFVSSILSKKKIGTSSTRLSLPVMSKYGTNSTHGSISTALAFCSLSADHLTTKDLMQHLQRMIGA